MNWTNISTKVLKFASKHSTTILCVGAVVGVVAVAVSASKAAMDTKKDLDNLKKKKDLEKKDYIKVGVKHYIPTIILTGTTAAMIIGGHKASLKRQAALMTAYSATKVALTDFQDKSKEILGERKVKKIKDEIAQDKINNDPLKEEPIIIDDKMGKHLFYDSHSGRYFRADIESVNKIINRLNHELMSSMFVSLNELYADLNEISSTRIDQIKQGDELGWNIDNGLIEVDYGTCIAANNEPCIVLDYLVGPRWDYKGNY